MSHHHLLRLSCRLGLLGLLCLVAAGPSARAQAPAPGASLDQILKEIAIYDGGIDSTASWKLRDYVLARKDDPKARAECEPKLVEFLRSSATPVAKMAASRALRVIASERSVPALQALLADDRVGDLALYALHPIPGATTDKALVQALSLPKVSLAVRIAVIASLGERRSADAVPALAPLLKQADLAKAAANALGRIGSDAASQVLVAAYPGAQGDLKLAIADAVMRCAERSLAAKNEGAASRLYDALAADASLPVQFRKAAAMGRIAAAGSGAAKIVTGYLETSDEAMHEAAIARLRDAVPPDAVGPVCARLPRLPEASQVKLLAALGGYPRDRVLPAILETARSNVVTVRMAAMKALATVGGSSEVALLARMAAAARGAEQSAARAALGALKGRAVDTAILDLLAKKPAEDVQAELLLAIADRRIYPAKDIVASALVSSSARIRLSALRAIRTIGTPSDIPAVLDLFVRSDDEMERTEAGRTTAALAQKMTDPDTRAGAIRTRVTAEKDPQLRARYIGLLSLVGDNSALALLRRALDSPDAAVYDAAVRALAAWPTSAAREDVLHLARDARNETHRLLAIAGLVRLIRLDRYRDPEAAVADLRQAAGFSWRPEEQRLVLGALGQFPCRDALDLATSFLREPAVAAEAGAAVKKLEEALKGKGR